MRYNMALTLFSTSIPVQHLISHFNFSNTKMAKRLTPRQRLVVIQLHYRYHADDDRVTIIMKCFKCVDALKFIEMRNIDLPMCFYDMKKLRVRRLCEENTRGS